MKCKHPVNVNGNTYNCGRCHACRINYTSSWTLRCLYELDNWESASFITLTYNNENLPKDISLNPNHLKQFWKNVRQALPEGRNIKYYACGEYGDKPFLPGVINHGRPHYHAIVYGLDSYNDDDRKLVFNCWHKCDEFLFDKSRKQNGMLPVCREDIAYTCGYVQKKLNGELGNELYGDRVRPFSRSSHYLGLDFCMKNAERLTKNGYTFLNKQKVAIPRYFREKLGVKQSELIKDNVIIPDVKILEHNASYLWDLFENDQKNKGIWNPNNLTMTSYRFQRWLDDWEFSLSRRVEKDYLQKKHLTSRYI